MSEGNASADEARTAADDAPGATSDAASGIVSGTVSSWTLARAFNAVALESFGGGLGAWMRQLIVADRRWLSEEDYISASTLCQVLPGANQLNPVSNA